MACNKFKMRSGVRTYNLSGQGCSASLLSVDLASELLQNNPNSVAVVISTELITQSLYHGHEKSMLLQARPPRASAVTPARDRRRTATGPPV
jgi:predicted naringenin-chalcone synthase